MLRFGDPPYLECSSKGDKRFSAFYARIPWRNNKSIEELYQFRKIILIDGQYVSGLSPKEAKGKKPLNIEDAHLFYSQLWREYFECHPELLDIVRQYNGFSDMFGSSGSCCQAKEIYDIAMREKGKV